MGPWTNTTLIEILKNHNKNYLVGCYHGSIIIKESMYTSVCPYVASTGISKLATSFWMIMRARAKIKNELEHSDPGYLHIPPPMLF